MSIVIQLPEVKGHESNRPHKCRHCQGQTFQRWGQHRKRIKDPKLKNVRVYRYRCTSCRRTFRHYPQGVSRAQQSARMKLLAAICWALGLSYRGIEQILSAFGISLSRMSSWRDVQAAAERLRGRQQWRPARLVGVDGAWLNGQGVMVAVDLGDGQPLAIAAIDEKDVAGVLRWLRGLKQRHGIGAIVTDDLVTYRSIADKLEIGHQICYFHMRRWVSRTLHSLEERLAPEWQGLLPQIKQILEELPPNGGRQLLAFYKQVPGQLKHGQIRTAEDELRHLLVRLSENWGRYTAFFQDPGLPWTNNRTEQAIGRMKMRAKTTRGYKTRSGMLNGLLISSTNLS